MPHRETLCSECGYEHELGYTVDLAPPEDVAVRSGPPAWFFLACALGGLVLLILTFADREMGAKGCIGLGVFLIVLAWIWAIFMAFVDETLEGFLCLLCPPYLVYYVAIEWTACRGATGTWFLGVTLALAGWGLLQPPT